MSAPSSPTSPVSPPSLPTLAALRSLWRPLALTRLSWAAIVAVCLSALALSLPQRLDELRVLVATTDSPRFGSLTFDPAVYVASAFTLELLGPFIFFTLALLIVWRRSDSISAIRISTLLFAFGAALPGTAYAIISATPIWRVTPGILQALGWTSLLIFAYLFPDGQWSPRWSRWVIPVWALWTSCFFAFAEPVLGGRPSLIVVSYLIWIAWLGTGVFAQAYRYMRIATPTQRQQTKWVALGFTSALMGILLISAQQIIALSQGQPVRTSALFITGALIIVTLSSTPIPISIAIAILRHNLYDIDRLINLTLVYGALTLTLGGLYVATIGASQMFIYLFTGSQNEPPLALVLTTLGAAALFQPLRRRIQVAIDRQFYRKSYNATKAVEYFAASLRTELDLTELTQRLTEVVHRTMQPKHISLWLVKPQTSAAHSSDASQIPTADHPPEPADGVVHRSSR